MDPLGCRLQCVFIRAVGLPAILAHEPTPKKSGEFEDGFEMHNRAACLRSRVQGAQMHASQLGLPSLVPASHLLDGSCCVFERFDCYWTFAQ